MTVMHEMPAYETPEPVDLDLEDVRRRIDGIDRAQGDDMAAAGLERDLYTDLIRAIAHGTAKGDLAELCRAALESEHIEFYRW